jgi:hypothetical protein
MTPHEKRAITQHLARAQAHREQAKIHLDRWEEIRGAP